MSRSDFELIAAYAANRDELAFAEIVRRHAGFVHASARRQTLDAHRVEEITQAVFILLAQKASSIRHDVILSGWLFRATRFAAADFRRADRRRQLRETNAYYQMLEESPLAVNPLAVEEDEAQWHRIATVLDGCLAKLGEADRNALLLRFFEDKPLAEVGKALKITADAARKRVVRALEKLHEMLQQQGVQSSVRTLESALLLHGAVATSNDLAAATLAAVSNNAFDSLTPAAALASSVLKRMAWLKMRSWLAAASIMLVVGVGAALPDLMSASASGAAIEAGDYRVAGYPDPGLVNRQLRRIQAALEQGNARELTPYIQFPLRINSPAGTRLVNANEWTAEFARLFPGSARSALLKSPTRNLLATPDGIMIGAGEVWLTPGKGVATQSSPQIGIVNLSPTL